MTADRALLLHAVLVVLTIGACRAGGSEVDPPLDPAAAAHAETGADQPYSSLPEPLARHLRLTHSESAEERLEALRELDRLHDPRAAERLRDLLNDPESRIRALAAETLGHLGTEGRLAAEPLAALLEDSAAIVRQAAVLALARVGGDQALERLLAFLDEVGPEDVEEAIDALGRLGRIEAVPAIVGHLESNRPSTVATTIAAIQRIGPGSAELVRPFLESEEPGARCAAARLLAGWESMADEPTLRRLSRANGDARVRVCALGALGRLGDAEAMEALSELVTEGSREDQAWAAEALGVVGTTEAVQGLIRALTVQHRDGAPNPAQAALLQLGPTARLALEEALPSGPPLRRTLVAETLGLLGDPAAIPSLERAVMDTDPSVRQAASSALQVLRGE